MERLVAVLLLGGVGWGQAPSYPVVFPASGALGREIGALVREPAVARAHWGVAVEAMDGTPLYGLNEGQLFQPASNAKLFTTAAAMALLGPERTFETRVEVRGPRAAQLEGNLVIVGGGEANLSGRVLPYSAAKHEAGVPVLAPLRNLEALADQVAASGLKVVTGDVVGDDTLFPYERYPSDWAVDDLVWGYGAPVSALTVNDNQVRVTITPGVAGESATVKVEPRIGYYTVENTVQTSWPPNAMDVVQGPAGAGASEPSTQVQFVREPGSRVLRISGAMRAGAPPENDEVAIDDPAEYAAMAFREMLIARGISVTGTAKAQHRLPTYAGGFLRNLGASETATRLADGGGMAASCITAGPEPGRILATHTSGKLAEDVVVTNKESQNLHAELMLHQLGLFLSCTPGSTLEGAQLVRAFLVHAGVAAEDFVFYDGSGLSGHDLVTPRATVKLLQYAAGQRWGAAWKASLPVGGVDGSLAGRFTAAPLKGHVFAKTGTLGEARALSGYLECKSGRTVVFSVMVGNHMPGTSADREVMDRIVGAIWAKN